MEGAGADANGQKPTKAAFELSECRLFIERFWEKMRFRTKHMATWLASRRCSQRPRERWPGALPTAPRGTAGSGMRTGKISIICGRGVFRVVRPKKDSYRAAAQDQGLFQQLRALPNAFGFLTVCASEYAGGDGVWLAQRPFRCTSEYPRSPCPFLQSACEISTPKNCSLSALSSPEALR